MDWIVEHHHLTESTAVEEFEIATKQLKSAYVTVLNKYMRIVKNPDLKINPSDQELSELDSAQERFDKARATMDKITEEIKSGIRK